MGFRPNNRVSSNEPRSVSERMDWNLLKTFSAVAIEKSISKGAARLNLSQPAVSQAIKRLEEQLESTLIERDSHRFELTEAGVSVLKIALAARQSIRETDEVVGSEAGAVKGVIRLLTVSGVESPEYDRVLRDMHATYPGIGFNIEVATTQEIVSALHRNTASFGIGIKQPGEVDIKQCLLSREQVFFYCSHAHPLFHEETVTIEHLKSARFVSFSGESLGGMVSPLSAHYGNPYIRQQIAASSSNTGEVLRMVLAGIGIGALSEHLCREYEAQGLLRRLVPESRVCEVSVMLMWSAHQVRNPAEEIFLGRMQAALASG
ncbi:LysR family transcriptional regulator [Pseudomonas viridiflava]|uniref:LysR family transcriptional regulator n=1 Tax=Pseudomonas viridiflava TaxID=33069 RepID=UPI001F07C163|nr:LysR family transcriptional regulator [Pseudomonas viridiflava]MEE4225115.1 LysR family transcriptional regulator [Pseudomonas viridiflava]